MNSRASSPTGSDASRSSTGPSAGPSTGPAHGGPTRRGPLPSIAVAVELGRALGALLLLLPRALLYLTQRAKLENEIAGDLTSEARIAPEPELAAAPLRPLRVFVACAEPSGEMHAVNLVRALRARLEALGAPPPELVGLGGARLAAEGVELIERPVDRAAMGLTGVLSALPYYLGLLRRSAACFRDRGLDLVLPVDSPALHVPLAHIAKRYRLPVVHFVTPQYWGWAPWRVASYRRAVDRALTILPFEPSWFARHGVEVSHVGHPIRDAWPSAPAPERSPEQVGDLVLLPGSRKGVIGRNLPWMLALAAELRLTQDVSVRIVHEHDELRDVLEEHVAAAQAEGWATIETGDLHRSLAGARAALSVSGTVLLELLHHRLPSVVIYRLANRREVTFGKLFLSVPFFSSVNLLAGREVYPEFSFAGDGPRGSVLAALRRALSDDAWRAGCHAGLEQAAERLGPAGAVGRAADQALAVALGTPSRASELSASVKTPGKPDEAGSTPPPQRTDLEDALGHAS